jgi:hypothetical protein
MMDAQGNMLLALIERAQVAADEDDRADALATLGERLQQRPSTLEQATLIELVAACLWKPRPGDLRRLRVLFEQHLHPLH